MPENPKSFPSSPVSLIAQIQHGSRRQCEDAARGIAERFWSPSVFFVVAALRQPVDEAYDTTSSMVARFLENPRSFVDGIDRTMGGLRVYWRTCLRNELNRKHRQRNTLTHGRGVPHVSFEEVQAECETIASLAKDPEHGFDLGVARRTMADALHALEGEETAAGRGARFAVLKPALEGDARGYAEMERELGITPEALRVAVHRLRKRFREMFRERVMQTMSGSPTDEEVDEEVRQLAGSLAGAAGAA